MIAARHYDEDALVTLLSSRTVGTDPHLTGCRECARRFDEFRMVTEALRDAATWDQRDVDLAPNPGTIASLRTFADTMAAEDRAAESWLSELLGGPRDGWMGTLNAHPEYRTAGMVRGLIAASDRALDTMPADAVAIAALAVEISEHLTGGASDSLTRLRGAAWRTRAYALYYTGSMAAADAAVRRSAEHFSLCASAEYEGARLNIVRSLVDRALERIPSAGLAARQSAEAFVAFGDTRRAASAQLAHVQSLFARDDYQEAMKVLRALEARQRASGDPGTHAYVLGNLGFCAWNLGNLTDALQYHESAAALLEDLGNRTEAVRERWNVATILATAGKLDEAFKRLGRVRSEFDELGLASASAQASLEMAELLLARGEFAMVENICRDVIAAFRAGGLAHTTRALTALAYMDEAVRSRRATPALARHVRDFIRRLPEDGELLFAPPPA